MSMGYTDKVSEAGKYTREDAMQAVNAAHIAQSEDHIQEIAVRVEDLPTGVQKGVNHDN